MSFFRNFPKIQYDLLETGEKVDFQNIFRHVDVDDIAIDPFASYAYYEIQSGERPDVVSQKLYGTPDYYWTFFIVNDFLKEGIAAWPKSEQELERYITDEFDDKSVLRILPYPSSISAGLRPVLSDNLYRGTFQGLDLSHPYLRVRRSGDSNAYALVSHYDVSLYQLHVFQVSNKQEFLNSNRALVLETYNPYHAQNPMYKTVEQLNDAWLEKVLIWIREEYDSVYQYFLTQVSTNLSRREYLRELETIALKSEFLGWTPDTVHEIGRNAVHVYLDAEGEPITAYDAHFRRVETPFGPRFFGISDSVQTQTRYEHEVEKNFAKRNIRVVKKSQIQAFAEEYKRLIQA